MKRSDVQAGLTGLFDFEDGVRRLIDGLLLHEALDNELDLSLRGGVVTQARLGSRRRVGVNGPGVETAMLILVLEGAADAEEHVMVVDERGEVPGIGQG
jgi:hypothetical protein